MKAPKRKRKSKVKDEDPPSGDDDWDTTGQLQVSDTWDIAADTWDNPSSSSQPLGAAAVDASSCTENWDVQAGKNMRPIQTLVENKFTSNMCLIGTENRWNYSRKAGM